MATKQLLPGAPLWGLPVLLLLLQIPTLQAQQFVNGKLIHKANNPYFSADIYNKYGTAYKNLYYSIGCNFSPEYDFSKRGKTEGFDTLKHRGCTEFYTALNRIAPGGPFSIDSSTGVSINFNGDTLSDFGFSLKLNAPLLKDSIYDLMFLITSIEIKQKFYDKNLYPYEDFKIKITQSNSPHTEGDEIAVIRRPDVYGKDTSISFGGSVYPVTSLYFTQDDYYYTVKKKVKGVNGGMYLTVKAKLVITDSVSRFFRRNLKPGVLNCTNYMYLNRGLHATRFELKCPFKIEQSGSLCNENNPLTLRSNNNHVTDKYLWSTGDTTVLIVVKEPGTYWLSKDRNGCKWIDTITIDSIRTIANKTLFYDKCKDSLIAIGMDSVSGQNKILWGNGVQNTHINVNKPDVYVRYSTIDACPLVDSFYVSDYPKHKAIATNNYTLCTNDSAIIRGLVNNIEWYKQNLMFSNLREIQIKGTKNDTLILKSFYNCWQYDTIYLNIMQCEINLKDYIFVPNAFTPNNDELNDVFKVYGKYIDELEMSIYNRWGELVFYSQNTKEGWDGTYQGEMVQNGIYTVSLKIKSVQLPKGYTPKTYIQTTVTLIR